MKPHRYWRITDNPGNISGFAFAEVQFRTTRGTPLAFRAGAASAHSALGGTPGPHDAAKAADGNPGTYYSWAGDSFGCYWCWDYGAGAGLAVCEVTIQARSDSSFGQAPAYFQVEYSDTGSPTNGGEWNIARAFTAAPWTAPGQVQTFTIPLVPFAPQVFIMA